MQSAGVGLMARALTARYAAACTTALQWQAAARMCQSPAAASPSSVAAAAVVRRRELRCCWRCCCAAAAVRPAWRPGRWPARGSKAACVILAPWLRRPPRAATHTRPLYLYAPWETNAAAGAPGAETGRCATGCWRTTALGAAQAVAMAAICSKRGSGGRCVVT